jgi:uncharacterized protein YbbC (DUF1343 family)
MKMKFKLGIDRIDEHLDLFKGKRVGLITNPTGINSKYQSTIDVLNEKTNLVALFSPEHGVRGNLQAGINLGTYVDEETGITVYSLYGDTRKPSKEMLDEIDILCIDIQDVGARFYTYVYTMAYSMMACKEEGKKFVVFDRPNPINASDYEGNILDINYRSFIGYYPTIQRHGMTIGELAYLFNKEFEIDCDLEVIKMAGYDRTKYLDELDILYVYPSPNLPTVNSCILYPGTCIFEGTNMSEGRGTATPFELIGAPYINSKELADKLNSMKIDGVHFRPQYFTPIYSKNKDLLCGGVYIHILDRKKLKSVSLGFVLLDTIRNLYPNDFKVNAPWREGGRTMLDLNTGTDKISKYLLTLEEQLAWIKEDTKKFGKTRSKYLIY